MKSLKDVKNYFAKHTVEYRYPSEEVYDSFAESVCREEGDLACLALSNALATYAKLKDTRIFFSESTWSEINLDRVCGHLDMYGTGEKVPSEVSDFGI